MEDEKHDFSASFSWWSGSHNRPLQSPWLQATLSDLDEKIQMMVNIIQDDGDSFVDRAERFYKRRPELLKIVQDLQNSYLSLAEKYDQLRSAEFIPAAHLRSPLSSSSSLKLLQNTNKENTETTKLEESPISQPQSVQQEDSETKTQISSFEQHSLNKPVSCKQCKTEEDNQGDNMNGGGLKKIVLAGDDSEEKENIWNQTRQKVSKLIEDNLKQQNELIRRNEEKREVMKQLRAQINRLMEENRALKSCLPSYKVDMKRNESRVSKLKGLNCIGQFQG
ncbi:hypothetical protein P3X46_005669 [Hevea brasiliensis]|uniref:NAB domain-containing protein n=1 Tax=Hevea brasiliensis TaxID=3981 RepID=A0ABQ9N1W1_HEVBR|nr:protein NETWORKED 3C [Hevea brasiliensis]KAJ9186134.1 hypothetical protein P3X46_005669 [Hevea brasiliensis]